MENRLHRQRNYCNPRSFNSRNAKIIVQDIQESAHRYQLANGFLMYLKNHYRDVSYEQFMALRKRALSGDVDGASKELRDLLER